MGLLLLRRDRGVRGARDAQVQALHPGPAGREQAHRGHRRERAGEVPALRARLLEHLAALRALLRVPQDQRFVQGPHPQRLRDIQVHPHRARLPGCSRHGEPASRYPLADWAMEGGDPCLPSPWSWVKCTSEAQPRVISINLSGKNLTGNVPPEVGALPCLAEIGLANNMLTGPIPDLSGSSNLSIIHLENNQLTGNVPSYLGSLLKLSELYLQNNKLSGSVPRALLSRSIIFNYSGNMYLGIAKQEKKHVIIIISALLGASLLLAAALCCYMLTRKTIKKDSSPEGPDDDDFTRKNKALPAQKNLQNPSTRSREIATETAHPYRLSELEVATNNFASRIGSGGFGIVYYGKLSDGKEIAVKVPTNDSYQGKKQFTNEVSLLSRIHHRNLVAFLGYCHEDGRNILVYEFMHNGTLKEHLHGRDKHISWIKRLEIAEDAAKDGMACCCWDEQGSSTSTLDARRRSSTGTSRRATSFLTSRCEPRCPTSGCPNSPPRSLTRRPTCEGRWDTWIHSTTSPSS
ncbi:hypothetical protein SETIT_5G470500v2 [Setaria italica]|uniref:Protein kinase domain-containing protein n=1 Tax=Setaria italica TaxID=4555 RepID=A0A368RGF0_SETIT|nr:hypothetical protein SETIT_5G470500v2 [Setaria italica]